MDGWMADLLAGWLPINRSTLFLPLSLSLSIHLSLLYPFSIYIPPSFPTLYLSVHPSVYLIVSPLVSSSIHPSIHLSIHSSIQPYITCALLPARASEQGNVIGSVSVYIYTVAPQRVTDPTVTDCSVNQTLKLNSYRISLIGTRAFY